MTSSTTAALKSASPTAVIWLCFAAIAFDGFDLVVYGAVVPSLLAYAPWALTPEKIGLIGSFALLGMMIGGLLVGYLTDLYGRRRVMISCVAFFSLFMIACSLAPGPELFGVFRFVSGLGLGGLIPTAIALTVEYSAPNRRNLNNAVMFSGYGIGGVVAALSAIALLKPFGFQGLMALGGLPLIILVPILWRLLPESPSYLTTQGKHSEAAVLRQRYGLKAPVPACTQVPTQPVTRAERVGRLLRGRWLVATILFSVAGICGQTLVFGLNTWLPQLMVLAGYSLNSSLMFLLTVNVGAITGAIVFSLLADRFGSRVVTAVSFITSGLALLLMGMGLVGGELLYVLVACIGFGSIGAQILLNGFVATYYPDATRGSALGITLGLGRLGAMFAIAAGGWLVAANLGTFVNFTSLALASLAGLVVVLIVPSSPSPTPVPHEESDEKESSGFLSPR